MRTQSAPPAQTAAPDGPDRSDGPGPRAWLPGYLALAFIWGSSFLFIKVGVAQLHPLYVTFGRVATGALTVLVVLVLSRGRLPRDPRIWGHLAVVGAVGVAIPFTLFGYGEQRVSSVLAGIWNATTPLIVLPVAVLVFGTERMTPRRLAGILLGFAGVLVVLGVWHGVGGAQFTGQLMCLGAAVCYGVAIPYQRRFLSGLPGSGVAIPAGQLLTYLLPIVATLIGVAGLHETISWYQPVGALVVLTGVAVSQGLLRAPAPRPRPPAPSAAATRSVSRRNGMWW